MEVGKDRSDITCDNAPVSDSKDELPPPELPDGQRREHVRVDLLRRCSVRWPGRPAESAELIDLSGTGCGIIVRRPVPEGTRGRVAIEFDDWTLDAPFVAKFVRPKGQSTYVGAKFEALDDREVDDIVREVFATMRRQIRNTRGG
jgi:c-di-GMP-binding flagellar brake protein YcgR